MLNSNKVDDIAFGPDGSTYISYGGWHSPKGIMRFNGTSWETITESVNGKLSFAPDGTLFIIQDFSEIYTYDGISFQEFPENPSEQFGYRSLGFDADENIWFGRDQGLLKYDIETGVQQDKNLKPQDFVLSNFPNPFNPSTTLSYSLANPGYITLYVYNSVGQKVATLVDRYISAGKHSAVFDGNGLASGMYFYLFSADGIQQSGRMTLVK